MEQWDLTLSILLSTVRIRPRLRIYGQIYPFAFKSSLGLRPRELLQTKGYILPYIPCLVQIRIQYTLHNTVYSVDYIVHKLPVWGCGVVWLSLVPAAPGKAVILRRVLQVTRPVGGAPGGSLLHGSSVLWRSIQSAIEGGKEVKIVWDIII